MPTIHVVTDSSCDLVEDDIDQLDIEVVPLSIRFGSEEFTDGLDLTVGEFYSRMAGPRRSPRPPARRPVPSRRRSSGQSGGCRRGDLPQHLE